MNLLRLRENFTTNWRNSFNANTPRKKNLYVIFTINSIFLFSAPVYEEQTALEVYDDGEWNFARHYWSSNPQKSSWIEFIFAESGCYYNFNHYGEGDRIITNEPCLNCTCHNRMLMCYLRVCPFTKAIGQDCIVEKREDQCCPVITCPTGINRD